MNAAIPRCTTTAQRTASTTEANSISMPSPVVLEDASAVLADQLVDQFAPMALQSGERLFLICAHQPRIFDDISIEDGGQSPFYSFLLHAPSPRLATLGWNAWYSGEYVPG